MSRRLGAHFRLEGNLDGGGRAPWTVTITPGPGGSLVLYARQYCGGAACGSCRLKRPSLERYVKPSGASWPAA